MKQQQLLEGMGRELLTFTLGAEEYGIAILKVQEIRGYDAVTTRCGSAGQQGTPACQKVDDGQDGTWKEF